MKSMPDGGQRKKTSQLTLFRSGSSRSPSFKNAEFDPMIMGKTLKVALLQTCYVIEDFGSKRRGIAIGNAWRILY